MNKATQLQRKSDELFAACLHFLLDRDERWLASISQLSSELLEDGYETSFEHKKKALVVKNIYAKLALIQRQDLDRVNPRTSDLEVLNGTR